MYTFPWIFYREGWGYSRISSLIGTDVEIHWTNGPGLGPDLDSNTKGLGETCTTGMTFHS